MAQDAIINRWDINGDVYDIQDAGRGRPLGVATLDENGVVPETQLPPTDLSNVSGVLPVVNGGTGQTTQLATNKAIIAEMTEGTSNVTDGTMFVSSYATDNGFADTNDSGPNRPYKRKFSAVWNYIKSKIQSIALTIGSTTSAITETLFGSISVKNASDAETANVSQGGVFTSKQNNSSSWWTSTNPRGKFVGTNGGTASGWSPLFAGKTVNGKYELGSLNNTIYLNYYKDSRTTNGIDKTIFDYTVDGTPNWNGNATTASNLTNAGKQAIFNIVHPIGEVYVQYPGSKTPAELYNVSGVITSTWTEQSYSGAFFRASGGNASAFITGTTYTQQAGQNGYHRHTISHTHALTGTQDGTAATASATSTVTTSDSLVYRRGDWSIGLGSATKIKTGGTISVSTTLSGNTSGASTGYSGYDGSSSVTENRPPNLTIRIWKRTA